MRQIWLLPFYRKKIKIIKMVMPQIPLFWWVMELGVSNISSHFKLARAPQHLLFWCQLSCTPVTLHSSYSASKFARSAFLRLILYNQPSKGRGIKKEMDRERSGRNKRVLWSTCDTKAERETIWGKGKGQQLERWVSEQKVKRYVGIKSPQCRGGRR